MNNKTEDSIQITVANFAGDGAKRDTFRVPKLVRREDRARHSKRLQRECGQASTLSTWDKGHIKGDKVTLQEVTLLSKFLNCIMN